MVCQSPQAQLPDGSITYTYSKECSRNVTNQTSLALLQQTFLGSKTQQQMESNPRSELINRCLKSETLKMETSEDIKTSLQKGEWVTSIDFKDAYFHIPVNQQYRKYLRFYIHCQSYQFRALPFSQSHISSSFSQAYPDLSCPVSGIKV